MGLLLELWEALIWALIWSAVNWWFLGLVTLVNLSSAAEVTQCEREAGEKKQILCGWSVLIVFVTLSCRCNTPLAAASSTHRISHLRTNPILSFLSLVKTCFSSLFLIILPFIISFPYPHQLQFHLFFFLSSTIYVYISTFPIVFPLFFTPCFLLLPCSSSLDSLIQISRFSVCLLSYSFYSFD